MTSMLKSPEEALTMALALAITAPTEEKAAICALNAERLAAGMTDDQIEACKAAAKVLADDLLGSEPEGD